MPTFLALYSDEGRSSPEPKDHPPDGRRRLSTHRFPASEGRASSTAGEGRPTGNSRDHLNAHRDGWHPTPPRGTRALLSRESFHGTIWECACGDGAISRVLDAVGHTVISTDLFDRGCGRGDHDFLADHTTAADHIITNPPYSPPVGLAAHGLFRMRSPASGLGGTVCMLLPINWEAAQSHLMAKCCRKYTFSRRLAMHRGGYTGKKGSPQLNVAWYVFSNEHSGGAITEVLPPDCGEEHSV